MVGIKSGDSRSLWGYWGFSSLSGFSATADGLWVGVEESYYYSRLAKASLLNDIIAR